VCMFLFGTLDYAESRPVKQVRNIGKKSSDTTIFK